MPGTRQSSRLASQKATDEKETIESIVEDATVATTDEGEEITVDLEVKDEASVHSIDVVKSTVEVQIEEGPGSVEENVDKEKEKEDVDLKQTDNGDSVEEKEANMISKSEMDNSGPEHDVVKSTVEVQIEEGPGSVEENVDKEKEKEDVDLKQTDNGDSVEEKEANMLSKSEMDNSGPEQKMEVNDQPVTDTKSKDEIDENTNSESCEEKETLEGDASPLEKDAEGSIDAIKEEANESITAKKTEEKSDGYTEALTKSSTDDAEPVGTEHKSEDSPTKAGTINQTLDTTKTSLASNLSLTEKKIDIFMQEPKFNKPFPASLAKLRNLTVNIGPIRQMDLRSEKLHEILKLTDNFEIKFELRDKEDLTGKIVKEKSGYVRLPFEITTPTYLIRVAFRLGNLHIDGRDMSVKFPDAFNKALVECQQYIDESRKFRAEKFEQRKRQIAVKNVPPNVTEDTMRSLFPEAQKITLNMEELPDGGRKVGSVLLEFDTEEACKHCLDTNKDVFVEDCQLKIFRLFSEKVSAFEKKFKNPKPQQFARGRGQGRGRGGAQRGGAQRGSFQAAKIRSRAIGLAIGNTARSRGGIGKGGGNFGRKSASSGPSSQQTGRKSPGATTIGPPSNVTSARKGQRDRKFSGSKPGKGNTYHGQFKDFKPKRESNRGRQRNRQGRGRGNQGYDCRSSERSPSFRGEQSRQSPYRAERSSPFRSSRTDQRYTSPSSSRDEDPMAMMEYLKSTIARMEEKMTGKNHGDRGYDSRHQEQSRSSQFSPRGRGSPNRGGGPGWGNQNRKRPAETREYEQEPKRQFMEDQTRRDSRNYYSTQQNIGSAQRRDSFGIVAGGSQNDYLNERDMSYYGDNYGSTFGSTNYGGNQVGSYGNRGGSAYDDSSDRNTRGFNSGYSGGSQFGGRGGGRGQASRGRGYNKGNKTSHW